MSKELLIQTLTDLSEKVNQLEIVVTHLKKEVIELKHENMRRNGIDPFARPTPYDVSRPRRKR